MINNLIKYAIENRLIVLVFAAVLVGLGVYAMLRLPMDVYPDLNAPNVNVMTESHGMAPEDIETLITFPLESAFNSLPHVRRVRSNSTLGLSKITIEFEYGTNIYFARQLVTEKLQMLAAALPEGVEPPFIGAISSMFADAVEYTIEGGDLYAMRDFAEWNLKPRLQTVQGVSIVVNQGGYLKQVHVLLDPNRLLQYDVTPREVMAALKANNMNASGGFLQEGPREKIVRGVGRIRTIEDVKSIILRANYGAPITIKDIADVKIGAFVRRGTAAVNGKEAVIVTVQNQYKANVMKTIRDVQEIIKHAMPDIPDAWSIRPFYNQLDMIQKSISNVSMAIYLGAVLVILILYLFLNNLRSTLIVAVTIPLAAIFAMLFFRAFGLTLNIMTLGGLAIGLGMIVDAAIIMTENIVRHLQACKGDLKEALVRGAQEVGRPIFYAVLIVLTVFMPLLTLQGIEGRMFIPLTIAVSAAILGSLILALTLTPVLCWTLVNNLPRCKESRFAMFLKRIYEPALQYSLRKPKMLILVCVGFLVLGVFAWVFTGSEFMPEMDESSLLVDILLPPDASLEESSRIAGRVAARLGELPEVRFVVTATGKAEGAEHAAPVNLTHSNCVLIPKEKRHKSIHRIKEEIRAITADIPGVNIQINAPLQHRINHVATGIRADIAIKLFGENRNTLMETADQVKDAITDIPGVSDLQVEQLSGAPQLQIQFKRNKLARLGLNVADVSELIEIALNGQVATEILETRRRTDVFVRFGDAFRNDRTKIENLLIHTTSGALIPLCDVADIREISSPGMIQRENGLRRAIVQCNVAGRDMGGTVQDIEAKLKTLTLPDGLFWTLGGTYENQIRAMRQLTIVVLITIGIVFMLLAMSFHSFKQGMLILINIPLALAGGMIILWITGYTLSVPSMVGFIALIGIAVQDGIVLINHINMHRKSGEKIRKAVITACRNKLRPVLMTTVTTMLGLLPLLLRNATGSEIQKPLAVVIVIGLFISTLLTLIVLPTLYLALEGKKEN